MIPEQDLAALVLTLQHLQKHLTGRNIAISPQAETEASGRHSETEAKKREKVMGEICTTADPSIQSNIWREHHRSADNL